MMNFIIIIKIPYCNIEINYYIILVKTLKLLVKIQIAKPRSVLLVENIIYFPH